MPAPPTWPKRGPHHQVPRWSVGSTRALASARSSAGASALGSFPGQSVEVIGEWSSNEQQAFEAVLKKFSDLTGAKVTYVSGGNNVNVLINSRLAGGQPPDVALIPMIGVA